MVDTPGSLLLKDGATPSIARPLGGTFDQANNFYATHGLRTDGQDTGAAWPFPMTDAVAEASLATIAESAALGATATLQATGNASLVTTATQITAAAASLVSVLAQISAAAASLVTVAGGARAPMTGFGVLTLVANTNTLASTVTLGPNSAAWPATPGLVNAENSGANPVYVAPLGGTAAAATCIPIAASDDYGFFRPATGMSLISPLGTTVILQW